MAETGSGIIIAGYGAGAIDRHLQPGNVGLGHVPGAKEDFTPEDHVRFAGLRPEEYETHPGGNVLNTLAYLATRQNTMYQEVRFCTVFGEDVEISGRLRAHLKRLAIVDNSIIVPGYAPSVSIVERDIDEQGHPADRMVRGRPRGLMADSMLIEHIRMAGYDAQAIVIGSLKSQVLNRRVLGAAPRDAQTFINFGSSELKTPDKAKNARRTLQRYPVTMLAINDEEIQQLFGSPDNPYKLAVRATKEGLAEHVMVTMGKNGVLLAHNGDIAHTTGRNLREVKIETAESGKIDPRHIVNTIGAGDRANAIAIDLILRGVPLQNIPRLIAEGTLSVLRVPGAHQDLYDTALGI